MLHNAGISFPTDCRTEARFAGRAILQAAVLQAGFRHSAERKGERSVHLALLVKQKKWRGDRKDPRAGIHA
jgi:hypothetical protein